MRLIKITKQGVVEKPKELLYYKKSDEGYTLFINGEPSRRHFETWSECKKDQDKRAYKNKKIKAHNRALTSPKYKSNE